MFYPFRHHSFLAVSALFAASIAVPAQNLRRPVITERSMTRSWLRCRAMCARRLLIPQTIEEQWKMRCRSTTCCCS